MYWKCSGTIQVSGIACLLFFPCSAIATEVVANTTVLQQRLSQLAEERTHLRSTANDTELLVDGAEQALDEVSECVCFTQIVTQC